MSLICYPLSDDDGFHYDYVCYINRSVCVVTWSMHGWPVYWTWSIHKHWMVINVIFLDHLVRRTVLKKNRKVPLKIFLEYASVSYD